MTARVALVSCNSYEQGQVTEAIRRSLDLLGGIGAFVQPGQRVLLKPNLVRPAAPERAVSTHPAVVIAVAQLVIEAGGQPIIVESPGGPFRAAALRLSYRVTGMDQVAEATGATLNLDTETTQVSHPEGQVLHRLDLVQALMDADVVINLPKLKTHNLTALTVAVKNLFGLVPGALKIGYHSKLQERARFCHAMLDILTYVKPALNIVDAIVGMEGEGPSGGDPREIGAIIASADALATDVVAAGLVGFDPLDVLTTRVAVERGLTDGRLESLELLGDPLETLRCAGFRRGIEAPLDPGLFPKTLRWLVTLGMSSQDSGSTEGEPDAHGRGLFRPLASGWVWRQLVAVPSAGPKCIGCGFCVSHCPVDAITLADGIAHMDRKTCIRCYCCHELCPHTAVELSKPWLGRLLMGS